MKILFSFIYLSLFILTPTYVFAQDIEATLSTSDSTSSFKITNPLSENLFQVGGNGSFRLLGISNDNHRINLRAATYVLDPTDWVEGASIKLASGSSNGGGDLNLTAGSDWRMFYISNGGNVNIRSGGVSTSDGICGNINIEAAGESLDGVNGGSINIIAGGGRPGGNITVKAGHGEGESSGGAGALSLSGGDSDSQYGGPVAIWGGQADIGGNVIISSGLSLSNSDGNCQISLNNNYNDGADIVLETGDGPNNGGDVEITLGSGDAGDDGLLIINGSGTYSGTWTQVSDRRLKKNIEDLNVAEKNVLMLRPVKYEMKREEYPKRNLPEGKQIGLIAQEVEKLFPQLVRTDADGFKSIDYTKVSVLLLDVVKEQNEQLKQQNKLLSELVHRIDRLENINRVSLNN